MKIENISVSDINIDKGTAILSFNIAETTTNVDIDLKINDDEFIQIATNQGQGNKTYTLKSMQKGVHNLILKISNEEEEYISEPFLVKFKINPTIEGLECIYSDSTGKFILRFTILGDELFTYNVNLKLDNKEYQEVMTSQIMGEKTLEATSKMGSHTCVLKVSDGYDEYETDIYSFEITNQKPILSKILVTNITNEGTAIIYYAVKDIENSQLIHSLNVDGRNTNINPTKVDYFYTYELSGLSVGSHVCNLSITDGTDVEMTDDFYIEIFANSTDKKEILRQSKVRYDFAYQSLKDIITSVISDGVFNYDIENMIIKKAQESYNETYSEFNRIAQQSIDIIGTNKVNLTKEDLTTQINDVDNALNTLETTMEGVFRDGLLSDSEKTLLRDNLNLIAKEKADVDSDYETLYNNEDLLDPAKSKLQTTYNAFVDAQNSLATTIDNIINKNGIIDNEDKASIDSAFETWRVALGDYRNASLEAIDSIAKKKIDDNTDTLNERWSELIVDIEAGIRAEVGSLEKKVNTISETVDVAVKNVEVMYYLSTSETSLEGGEWLTEAPAWTQGKYMWSKTVTTLSNDEVKESNPVCIAGAKGQDAITYYTWIMYADDSEGNGISNSPDGKEYIGLAYNKTTQTESTNPSDYNWSLIKGTDGINGTNGKDGINYYTWIKYSDNADGTSLYESPNENTKYIGIAVNKTSQVESTNKNDYTWSKFRGDDGINATTYYTWIMYADDENGNGISNSPNGKKYIGFAYNKTTQTESTNRNDYTWSLIKGEDGKDGTDGTNGINGQDGKDGINYYTWIKYSDNADGTNLYDTPNSDTEYIGIAVNKTTQTESTNKGDYTWSKFRGDDGVDGETYYTWIKYADDSSGNGLSDSPNGKKYIGFAYNKTTQTESTNRSDYSWSLIKGEDGKDGTDGTNGINGQDGKDGITYYTWIKYSNYADGTSLYDTPNDSTEYIGIAVNQTSQTESTNKSDYKWSKFRGDDGVNGSDGDDGVGVESVTEEYYLSTSKTTQTGGSWVTSPPTWSKGYYMWTRSKIVYTNGVTEYTDPICDSSWEVADEVAKEVEEIDRKVATLEITNESITSTVSSMQSTVNGFDERISSTQQTANKINWVVASGTSSSNMTLTSDALNIISSNINLTGKVTFNSFNSNLQAQADEWDASYNTVYNWAYGYPSSTNTTTINGAYIETGTISADKIMANTISVDMLKSNNANPIIRLFDQCSIDATHLYEKGQGDGIRLKWDNYNYIYVSEDYIGFHLTNGGETYLLALEAPSGVPQFITKSGNKLILDSSLTYKGETVVTSGNVSSYCAPASHNHSGTYSPANHNHSGTYSPANHNHSGTYAPSSHSHDSISYSSAYIDLYGSTMYMGAGSRIIVSDCDFVCEYGSENCGSYSYPWRSVVADMLIYLSYCGKADGDEEKLSEADISYNFMKQYSNSINLKQQSLKIVSSSHENEQQEPTPVIEETIQNAVMEKANAIYEYDDEGVNLFTNASSLIETMAQTVEVLINKIEELETTVADLQNKLGE